MDKDVCYYQAQSKFELPIDLSKQKLACKIGCSPHQIASALIALDGENETVLNSCYSKLVRGRNAGVIPEKQNTSELDNTTFAFYYEIVELLSALIKAKCENKRAKRDEIAQYTIKALADELSDILTTSVQLNFSQSKILGNPNVQNELNRQFVTEADKRLLAVKYIVEHDPTAEQILAVCDKLDSLIMEWIYGKDFNYYATKKITVKSIEELYDSLMKVRMDGYDTCIPTDSSTAPQAPPVIRFEGPVDIIEDLRKSLPEGCKRMTDTQQIARLAQAYERFLISHIDESERASIATSTKGYLALKSYVYAKETLDSIEAAIRKDLIEFAKEQFHELKSLEYIPFPTSAFKTASMQSDFLKERIKNVQAKIMYEFYKPFRLLRIFYSIRNFTCFSNIASNFMNDILKNSPPFQQLVIQMEQAIFQLGKENFQLPLAKSLSKLSEKEIFTDYFSQIPREEFLREYKKTVVPVFAENPEILEPVLESLITGAYLQNTLSEALAVSSLLFWSCQIAMIDSIDEWVSRLSEDYTNLAKFYCEIEQIQKERL